MNDIKNMRLDNAKLKQQYEKLSKKMTNQKDKFDAALKKTKQQYEQKISILQEGKKKKISKDGNKRQ